MHHGGEVPLDLERCRELLAVGDVAGATSTAQPRPASSATSLSTPSAAPSRPAEEQDPAHAVLASKMAGDKHSEPTGAAGDRDGAATPPARRPGGSRRHALKPGSEQASLADGELWLPGGDRCVKP